MAVTVVSGVTDIFRDPSSGGGGLSTYGTLTNAQILALPTPLENETADSSDDFIRMVFIVGAWRTTLGGLLV